MSKFDVNKIITESICENAITEELEIMKGWYGNKLYDKWNHAKEYANELWSKTKKFGQDNFTLDPDKIDLPKTGMTGAAIAAGLGALALRRRMKKAQKGQ